MSTDEFSGDVEIEAFGVPGTETVWHGGEAGASMGRVEDHAFWTEEDTTPDTHVAFRAVFTLDRETGCVARFLAPAGFRIWIDGELLAWGPHRFAAALPEIARKEVALKPGEHRVAVHACHEGLTHRISSDVDPFVYFRLLDAAERDEIPLNWSYRVLTEYAKTGLRVSPLQGWMEWVETPLGRSWIAREVSEAEEWRPVASYAPARESLGPCVPSFMEIPDRLPLLEPRLVDEGAYRDSFTGYKWDDPSGQFLLAEKNPPPDRDADGRYWVYDLGRIRIGAMELDIETSARAEVTIAYGEKLTPEGRVSPIVPLSAGPTRFIQHFTVDAGHPEIRPLQALGGRWIEVRVQCGARPSRVTARFLERDYLGAPVASLDLGDPGLEDIWTVGLDTLRSSAEDAFVDSVRERGEWVGDVASAAMELSMLGWGRTDLARRALFHSAATARSDGLVSGCGPGEAIYLGSYAAEWTCAVLRCAELEGSTDLLEALYRSGRANILAIDALVNASGDHRLPWPFIDWGYVAPEDGPDLALLCHVVMAFEAWERWRERVGRRDESAARISGKCESLRRVVSAALEARAEPDYHEAVLTSALGLFPPERAADIVLKTVRRSFPFDPAGTRLRAPTRAVRNLVTPYFTNYSFRVLLENGHADEAIRYWREGWGWMRDQGAETWWEVFDDRWSHCHYWSGAPTWQLSRYLLGLRPVWDKGLPGYELKISPSSLRRASGRIGLRPGQAADIAWTGDGERIHYELEIPIGIRLRAGTEWMELSPGRHQWTLRADGTAGAFRL